MFKCIDNGAVMLSRRRAVRGPDMLPFNMGAGGASSVDTGDIPASLRFRSGASAYLSADVWCADR